MAIGLCPCCEVNLRLTDFRVTAITYTFCENIGYLTFVTVFCRRKALDMLDEFNDLSIVDDSDSVACVIIKIFKLAIAVEYHDIENRNIRVVWQEFA